MTAIVIPCCDAPKDTWITPDHPMTKVFLKVQLPKLCSYLFNCPGREFSYKLTFPNAPDALEKLVQKTLPETPDEPQMRWCNEVHKLLSLLEDHLLLMDLCAIVIGFMSHDFIPLSWKDIAVKVVYFSEPV